MYKYFFKRLQVRFGFFKKSSSLETERDSEDERDEPYDEEEFVRDVIAHDWHEELNYI